MAFFRSVTDFNYHHPFQGKRIGSEPVRLERDSWLDSQIDAGLIEEVKDEPVDKPAKAEKKQGE